MYRLTKLLSAALLGVSFIALSSGQTGAPPTNTDQARLDELLGRVRERIQKYHESLFSIAVTEVVKQQELHSNATPKGRV